jgi:hypothetical protein
MSDLSPLRRQAAHANSWWLSGPRSPALPVMVAGAVGYGLAWLIHGRAGHAPQARRSRPLSSGGHTGPGNARDGSTGWNQPRPSGDSPKPYGDALPDVVRAVTDNGERF